MKCSICKSLVHLKCLPSVSTDDSVYVLKYMNVWYCTICVEHIFPYNHLFEDDEFFTALSEKWEMSHMVPYDIVKNQNKLFLPFDLNEDGNSPLSENDPDINFYNNQCNAVLNACDYYLEESFNAKMRNFAIPSNTFSVIHENIRNVIYVNSKLSF